MTGRGRWFDLICVHQHAHRVSLLNTIPGEDACTTLTVRVVVLLRSLLFLFLLYFV